LKEKKEKKNFQSFKIVLARCKRSKLIFFVKACGCDVLGWGCPFKLVRASLRKLEYFLSNSSYGKASSLARKNYTSFKNLASDNHSAYFTQ
jgi:hypothetical protein